MLFNITGKHLDITEAIKNHAQQKTAKMTKFYNSVNQVEVIIDGSLGAQNSVEIIARAEHSKVFVASESGDDVYRCIDLAAHKLERQLRRKKTRERNNKHTGPPESQ